MVRTKGILFLQGWSGLPPVISFPQWRLMQDDDAGGLIAVLAIVQYGKFILYILEFPLSLL
jgi:hypothetical protein